MGSVVCHVATGQVYGIDAHACLEALAADVYVYSPNTGRSKKVWVRGKKDMEDGRFTPLAIHVVGGSVVCWDPGLKSRREALGLSQHDVAKKLGCSRSRISHIEQGFVHHTSHRVVEARKLYTNLEARDA